MASEQKPTDYSDENWTSDESSKVFERAAQLQSADALADPDESLDRATLDKSAGRAGIDEKYVKQAVESLRAEEQAAQAKQAQLEQQRAARQKQLRKWSVPAAVIFGLYALLSYSSLNNKYTTVERQQAQLENVLQRRHDLIPNLISASKAASAHEEKTFATLAQLESQASSEEHLTRRAQLENQLSDSMQGALNSLRGQSSQPMFLRLSDEMAGAENRIAVERKRYNDAVGEYNKTAHAFPLFLIRPLLGFPPQKPYFQAESAAREVPKF